MRDSETLAAPDEIRAYLIDQLNRALRRPGMYGNELAIRMLIDHLLFVERRPEKLDEREERGIWTNTGVTGAFRDVIPERRYEYGAAAVYAEFAQDCGWLRPDRVMPADEHASLRDRVRQWAAEDRSWADVVREFGPPSVLFGGTNPLWGKTLGYLSEVPGDPMVSFHLWNGSTSGSWPDRDEPVLLAVRFGDGPFLQTLTFTPEGERRRPRLTTP